MTNDLAVDFVGFCNLILKIAFLWRGIDGKSIEDVLEDILEDDISALRI